MVPANQLTGKQATAGQAAGRAALRALPDQELLVKVIMVRLLARKALARLGAAEVLVQQRQI
jgi:hypothetical protein